MSVFSAQEFERGFKQLYKPLCLFALRYVEPIEEAEDVVQQAFTDVWEKSREGAVVIQDLKPYMYRAVRNRALSAAANNRTERINDSLTEIEDLSEEERIRTAERDVRLWDVIDCLPAERKKIFLLAKRDGLKYQEIAEELQISVKTVENQMGKALKSLRETVQRIYLFFFG